MNKLTKLFLVLIVILAFGIRVYKIDSVPPSLTWDEADVGYNAWTIASYGRDEWGIFFPLVFKSFGDDKLPVHIYSTALSVKMLGLSEFSTRVPFVLYGTLSVLIIFFLTKEFFKSSLVGIFSSLLLATSPYHIHFSRFNHEVTATLFFFMLGLLFFYLSIKKIKSLLPLSILSFGIGIISYHSAKIVAPPIILILTVLYFKDLIKNKFYALLSLGILFIFISLFVIEPRFLGLARVNQTAFGINEIKKTFIFQKTNNETLGKIEIISNNYLKHLSGDYLFIKGDPNPRLSSQVSGEFFKIDALFIVIGLLFLIKQRNSSSFVLLAWALLSPLPASLTSESPHAARALFMMGSLNIISALGIYTTYLILKNKTFQKFFLISVTLLYLWFFINFVSGYFTHFANNYGHDFQYGMKEAVLYVKENSNFSHIFTTILRGQPYIFFLYYLQTPLPDYLNNVVYNRGESKSYNLVDYFDKYYFGVWDPIESMPTPNVLYVLTENEYDGLRHKGEFDVKKIIYYPNGKIAFYLVSAKM